MSIYLNNASQTPIKPEVVETITNVLKNNWYNPSDIFQSGLDAKNLMEDARQTIANSINADPEEIIFCSSGSEANSLAINGYVKHCDTVLFTSSVEHNSILNINCPKKIIPVDDKGFVIKSELEEAFMLYGNDEDVLVSIMAANNEIGTINDIKEFARLTHEHNHVFHSDLTQYYPHYRVDVKELGLDMATISFHKMGCCPGIAVLYKSKDIKLKPIIAGEQESGLRGGTECVPLICGAAKAVELLDYSSADKLEIKRDKLFYYLLREIKTVRLNGADVFGNSRLCNNLNFRIDGIDNQQLLALLDLSGVCCSAGSSCNSYNPKPSRVLKAIGLTDKQCNESIRVTIDENITDEDILQFVKILKGCVYTLKG